MLLLRLDTVPYRYTTTQDCTQPVYMCRIYMEMAVSDTMLMMDML